MDVDDKELFNAATTDEPIPEVVTEAPEAPAQEQPQQDGRARDEHGRFAARQSEPAQQQPAPEAAKEDGANVPSWRLREVREEAERRVAETEARWRSQFEMLQRQNQPKPEPVPAPDMFENPPGFVDHYLKQGISPLEQRVQAAEERLQRQVENNSRRDAEREHGPELVRAAYSWIAENVQARDPNVLHIYHQVMQSAHPFDDIVKAFEEVSIVQQVKAAGGAAKWREQQLSQAPQSNGRQQPGNPQGSIVKLPPSMSRLPNAQVAGDDDNDVSDAALFRHATR